MHRNQTSQAMASQERIDLGEREIQNMSIEEQP